MHEIIVDKEDLIIRVLQRTLNDLLEAYFRTPPHVSSKKYIERALRRIQNTYSFIVAVRAQQEFKGTP